MPTLRAWRLPGSILAYPAALGLTCLTGLPWIFPVAAAPKKPAAAKGQTPAFEQFLDQWYPIQVKQKDGVGRPDIDAFEAVMTPEDRTKGFFVAFDYTSDALREIDRFFRKSGKAIIALTVREILDEEIARTLA